MNFFRKIVLIWMLGWLPLSGAIAAAMPISAMAGNVMMVSAAAEEADVTTADVMSALPCHNAAKSMGTTKNSSCTHCALCHLAGALMLPSIPDLQGPTPLHNFVAQALSPQISFIPDLISPPPRARAA